MNKNKRLQIIILIFGVSIGLFSMNRAITAKKRWQEKLNKADILNIDHMLRASKYAIGKNKKSGGWFVSKNESKKIKGKFSEKKFYLFIDEQEKTLFFNKYLANKLYLINNTEEDKCLDVQDSQLFIKMQARDSLGMWKDIEFIPRSKCGNSFHEICLERKKIWEFPSVKFEGEFNTKLRYKLENRDEIIYSNEISENINIGQFIKSKRNSSTNLMNPYYE